MKCRGQKLVSLSVTEAEFIALIVCPQDMLFVMHVIESLGLQVEKPMVLFCDNQGAVDLANNWSVSGRTRHMAVRQFFLRDLKEKRILIVRWCPGEHMSSDLFTKNLDGPTHWKHVPTCMG